MGVGRVSSPEGVAPEALGSAHRFLAPYQAIRCADGYITIGAGTDRLFAELCDVLDHPEWAADAEFADTSARVRNREALVERIEAITATKPKAHWLAQLDARGIPCGPINTYAEAFADPQVHCAQDGRGDRSSDARPQRTLGSPIKMSDTPPVVGRHVPLLGEHTGEVLRELGLTAQEIAEIVRHFPDF